MKKKVFREKYNEIWREQAEKHYKTVADSLKVIEKLEEEKPKKKTKKGVK